MSIKVTSLIWESGLFSGSQLIVLLAIADMGNDEGKSIYPSVGHVAKKARLSQARARRILHSLEQDGFISIKEKGGRSTNIYSINLSKFAPTPLAPALGHPWRGRKGTPGAGASLSVIESLEETKPPHPLSGGEGSLASPSKAEKTPPASEPLPAVLDTPEFREAWGEFLQHRREHKAKLTPTATKRCLANLAKVGADEAVRILNRSISNGWVGVFPNKQERPEPSGNVYPKYKPPDPNEKALTPEEKRSIRLKLVAEGAIPNRVAHT